MKHDIIIIGTGIVGLATAFQLKQLNPKIKLAMLEKEKDVAMHQTGNNSGVIHAGLYYKPGSLKARNCLEGYRMLLDFCREHQIKHEICGKVVVATSEKELTVMEKLFERALQNGLDQCKKLSASEVKDLEPHVQSMGGIHVPYTGIIDYKEVARKIREILENQYDVEFFMEHEVINIKYAGNAEIITPRKTFECKCYVNTAGLYSDRIARFNHPRLDVRIIPFRGEYYKLKASRQSLVNNLVYPVPDPAFPFLGVHFTRLIHGGVEAGPNAVFAFKKEGYKKTSFSIPDSIHSLSWWGFQKIMLKYMKVGLGEFYRSFSKPAFTRALQKLVPATREEDLVPGGAGVRAQACDRDGNLLDDFRIEEDPFGINVLNAPSPAATASLSIGKSIAQLALKRF